MGTSHPADPFNLQRFLDAQADVYELACAELRHGRKSGHWMWFVFPQLKGLGHSAMAEKFAISSRQEAAAYAGHPILGPRLRECTRLVKAIEGRSIRQIFDAPDDLKFRSCMTLFARICTDDSIFAEAIQQYFGGVLDTLTLDRL